MRHRQIISLGIGAMLALTLIPIAAGPASANGNCITYWGARGAGTADDPYPVATQLDLEEVWYCPSRVFTQTADIALTGSWRPLGTLVNPFTGSYDGNDFTITGLSTSDGTATRVGLFGQSASPAVITDTHVSGSITGTYIVGGLVANAQETTITGSSADVSIVAGDPAGPSVEAIGGLVGYADRSTVADSWATGAITVHPAVAPGNATHFGGLIGNSELSTVSASRASGEVTADSLAGGLIGFMTGGSLTESFATGSVSGRQYLGALVGAAYGLGPNVVTMHDVYARGSVNASVTEGAGLIGEIQTTAGGGTWGRAYATGSVSGAAYLGGVAGFVTPALSWASTYWDTQTSGQAAASGNGLLAGATGESTSAMTDIATYQAAGWNIGSWTSSGTTWGICPNVNDGYPFLQVFYTANPCAPASDGPPPPPWHQSYARAEADTCLAGWNPSWAQWPNDNTGGFVCNRTLVYNQSSGVWDLRRLLLAR